MEPVLPEQATWRLCIGLAQGIALSALHHAAQTKGWPATNPELLAALMAVAVFVPTLAVSAIGNLRLRTMIVWAVAATAICGALAAYDIARDPVALFGMAHFARTQAGIGTMLALGTSLFIVHTLVVAGETDRRVFATYPTYFDVSWKHGVQFMLAALFVGVLWGLLFLGSGLFQLIHIDFFARLIRQPNFYFPVTSLATACALHVTDVRAGLVRGTRTLLLVLLSWLLPLMALIAAGFLMSLPFTGLAPLWGTRFGAKLLLTATAVLIVLINATHQDGRAEPKSASLLRRDSSRPARRSIWLDAEPHRRGGVRRRRGGLCVRLRHRGGTVAAPDASARMDQLDRVDHGRRGDVGAAFANSRSGPDFGVRSGAAAPRRAGGARTLRLWFPSLQGWEVWRRSA